MTPAEWRDKTVADLEKTKRYTTDVVVESFEFISGQGQAQQINKDINSNGGFEEDMTPVDDGDMPF